MTLLSEHSSNSRCAGLVIFLLLVIFGLVSYVVYKEVLVGENMMPQHQDSKEYVLRVYGDFFKTPEEQKGVEREYFSNPNNTKEVPFVANKPYTYYRDICKNMTFQRLSELTQQGRRRRQTSLVPADTQMPPVGNNRITYHGCCQSKRIFISPPKAISDHDGTEVELVHFDNEERQYFLVDQCWQDLNCGLMCQCRIQVGLFRALVHNDEYDPDSDDSGEDIPPYLVRTVRLGGSCKCINNLNPSSMWG